MNLVDLENLHFNRGQKVKYRTHLTVGVLCGTLVGVVGIIYGSPAASLVGVSVHTVTSLIWIWE
jgi:hypothetical protein